MGMRRFGLALLSWAVVMGCAATSTETSSKTSPKTNTTVSTDKRLPTQNVSLDSVGLDAAAMDRKADPCVDFYQFACGGWVAATEIPQDMPMWARTFGPILRHNDQVLKSILEDAASATNPNPNTKKLGDFYASCLDQAAIDAAGISPIKDMLARARKVKSPAEIMAMVADLHSKLMFPIFLVYGHEDPADATRVITKLDQEGLGLPEREFYTDDDADKKDIRKAYVEHIARMLVLGGYDKKNAARDAAEVLDVETQIAKISKTSVERQDPKGMYNLLTTNDLGKKTPHIAWDAYFKALGIPGVKEVNVTSIPFFEGVDKLLTTIKPSAWQNYLSFTILRAMAPYLSKPFEDEAFVLTKRLTGQKEQKPRWKRCMNFADDELGDILAQSFVERNFAGESKRAAEKMVHDISATFEAALASLAWMDAKTRERALAKLKAVEYLIGYPAKWRTYDYPIDRKQFALNAMNGDAFEQKFRLGKIGKPVDRGEWMINAPTVNAYYDPQKNNIVFAAGVLQPPFYDIKASLQVNLGAIGTIVGHEITHGFDNGGSLYAANGNLENWWDPAVRKQFEEKAACLVQQYSKYEAAPGIMLDGERTLDENIADLGGLKFAYRAYREARKDATNAIVADGFTEDQQFFLAAGQVWCEKASPEFGRIIAQTDVHSPGKFRVNGPASNMPEFATAFSCKEGTPMHPVKTCEVW